MTEIDRGNHPDISEASGTGVASLTEIESSTNTSEITVYHYTSLLRAGAILGQQEEKTSGLRPKRRIGLKPYSQNNLPAIFGLPEPTPSNWTNNPQFPVTWALLTHRFQHDGPLLLEVGIDPEKDKAFVADRAHIEGLLYEDKTTIPDKFLHLTKTSMEERAQLNVAVAK